MTAHAEPLVVDNKKASFILIRKKKEARRKRNQADTKGDREADK